MGNSPPVSMYVLVSALPASIAGVNANAPCIASTLCRLRRSTSVSSFGATAAAAATSGAFSNAAAAAAAAAAAFDAACAALWSRTPRNVAPAAASASASLRPVDPSVAWSCATVRLGSSTGVKVCALHRSTYCTTHTHTRRQCRGST